MATYANVKPTDKAVVRDVNCQEQPNHSQLSQRMLGQLQLRGLTLDHFRHLVV